MHVPKYKYTKVDGATGRDSLFADVLFGFEAWRANKIRAAGQGKEE
jgi:hypothetical protein